MQQKLSKTKHKMKNGKKSQKVSAEEQNHFP